MIYFELDAGYPKRTESESRSAEIAWTATADAGETIEQAYAAAGAYVSRQYELMYLQSVKFAPTGAKNLVTGLENQWRLVITYGDIPGNRREDAMTGPGTPDPLLGFGVHFTTAGGTRRVTQCLTDANGNPAQKVFAKAGRTPTDYKGCVGITKDGVEGADVTFGRFSWNERHTIPVQSVSWNYAHELRDLSPSTNATRFRGFDIGEVQFLHADGDRKNQESWDITFNFVADKNVSETIDGITFQKGAHDHIQFLYDKDVDPTTLFAVNKVREIVVSTLIPKADFKKLGIPIQ